MTIAVDLDDVIANYLESIIDFHNAKYSTKLCYGDFCTYKYSDAWGGTDEDSLKKIMEFHGSDHFINMKPVDGAVEALKKLKEKYRLNIITSRALETEIITRQWLTKHIHGLFEDVYFTNVYSVTGEKLKKSEVCKRLGVSTIIEDASHYAEDCAAKGIKVLLYDRPWNKNFEHLHVKRVFSWKDILTVLM